MDYEVAHQNIQDLNRFYKREGLDKLRNEATTRLHLIDSLLFECLAWNREDCVAEEAHAGEYTDYSLFAPHRSLIVEAKKEGLHFELPVGMAKSVYQIAFFKNSQREVYTAIEQAIDYCLLRGTLFGCVSNGHQLVAFLGSRTDGVPPLEGKAVVFDSIESMENRFLELWQSLSKPGIQSHYLASVLQQRSTLSPPDKLSAKIAGYPGYKNRNDIQNDLQIHPTEEPSAGRAE